MSKDNARYFYYLITEFMLTGLALYLIYEGKIVEGFLCFIWAEVRSFHIKTRGKK